MSHDSHSPAAPEKSNSPALDDSSQDGTPNELLAPGSSARDRKDSPPSFSAAVAHAEQSVVRVCGRRGHVASGIIIDGGRVMTSARVLGNTEQATVVLGQLRSEAKVLGRDLVSDVALLQLAQADLGRAIAFRSDAGLRVGEPVMALGRPGGIIRASSRVIGALADGLLLDGGLKLDRYIESDRRLPRGFSGGPLIDIEGNAIGLNTRAVVRGADLCIPASTLTALAASLQAHGSVRRGYLGIRVHSVRVPTAIREAQSLTQRRGALIVSLAERGPAAQGGLLLGDTIVTLAGEPVLGPRALRAALLPLPEQDVSLEVIRAGKRTALNLRTGALAA